MESKIERVLSFNRNLYMALGWFNFCWVIARIIFYYYHYGVHIYPVNEDEAFYIWANTRLAYFVILLIFLQVITRICLEINKFFKHFF